ncbi:MAG: DNA polymerase III subunit beta [Candidatus Brocadiaceae bacterium]|nr:DNA polymerase III subunit beta [Candidatus Brocadiaceae bacterium]
MNIHFAGADLYKGFNLVSNIVPSLAMKQILKGVKLEAVDNSVELTASDLEVLVKYKIPVKQCTGEGGIVLPAGRVNNILREWIDSEDVSLSIEEGCCTLKSKCGYFKILGEDFRQFPEISKDNLTDFVEIDGDVITKMIDHVAYAVSTIKTRNRFCGIFTKIYADDIVMVGADGNRLSLIKRKVKNTQNITMEGIVSIKCFKFLQRFISENKGGIVRVSMDDSRICFMGDRGEVISQLIEGQYPNYEEFIPTQNDKKVEADREEFSSIVKMASFVNNEEERVIKMSLKKGKLQLLSETADIGEAHLEITVSYDGPDFLGNFNPDYLLDALKASDSDTVLMELGDPGSAALLRTGHEQLCVMMPIEF